MHTHTSSIIQLITIICSQKTWPRPVNDLTHAHDAPAAITPTHSSDQVIWTSSQLLNTPTNIYYKNPITKELKHLLWTYITKITE